MKNYTGERKGEHHQNHPPQKLVQNDSYNNEHEQIDFISAQANPNKSYDLALVVDLDGVGQELGSLPITAKCAVPTVVFEPYEAISFGEVFIR